MFFYKGMNFNSKSSQKTKSTSLYWTCQLLGWGIVSMYWAYTVYTRDNYSVLYTFVNYILDIGIGISLTHFYRWLAIKFRWSELVIKKLLLRVIPMISILSLLYAFLCNVKWYVYWTWVAGVYKDLWNALLYWDPVFITGLRLMSIWILAYHLYHYYRKEIQTAKENAQLSVIAKQIQLDNLSAQLNPHFLFNSLNSIKSLVIENPNKARRAIDLLSDLLRSSLYEKDKDVISIEEELALVKDYIEIEKLRFEERLAIDIHVDPVLKPYKIPALTIQLLVENAIKHGIDKIIDGGLIKLIISKNKDQVSIQVQNPGKLSTVNSKGVGLKNLRERLHIQYKGKASFNIGMYDENTVSANLLISYQSNENF